MTKSASIFAAVLFLFLFSSCKKQLAVCTGDCAGIIASGKVIDGVSGEAAPNVPVTLYWQRYGTLVAGRVDIKSVKSSGSGEFVFSANIDTTYFQQGYTLELAVASGGDYMVRQATGNTETSVHKYDTSAFHGVTFDVFRQAKLVIRLHRTQTDDFKGFAVWHAAITDFFEPAYHVDSPQEVIDRKQYELNVNTVADVYTKIRVYKTAINGTESQRTDSVRCSAGSTTYFDVYF